MCATTTESKTWADGPDLASHAGTASNADCFAYCAAYMGSRGEKCDLSIRDPSNGNCFLKQSSPLLRSQTLTTTFCTLEVPGASQWSVLSTARERQ